MYFEPMKKNYYRFPSSNSISDLDSRYYFPEKTHASGDHSHFEASSNHYVSKSDNFIDV